jgi:4'-phosphopantetheinyl transferase
VSITHSGQWAGVAVTAAGPVGLDVEQISARFSIESLSRMVLSPQEEPVTEAGFYVYWTRKEAILKATGDGLREAMTKLTVSAPGEPARLLDAAGRPDLVELTQLQDLAPGAGYAAAAAVLSPLPLLVSQRFLAAG